MCEVNCRKGEHLELKTSQLEKRVLFLLFQRYNVFPCSELSSIIIVFLFSEARYCPYNHPFAVNNGTHCCSFGNKRNNTDIGCNGNGTVEFSDPKECCKRDDWIECPNKVGGCKTHALSDRELTKLEYWTIFSVLYIEYKDQVDEAQTLPCMFIQPLVSLPIQIVFDFLYIRDSKATWFCFFKTILIFSEFCPLNPTFQRAKDSYTGTYYKPLADGTVLKYEAEQKCTKEFNGAHLPHFVTEEDVEVVSGIVVPISGIAIVDNSFFSMRNIRA